MIDQFGIQLFLQVGRTLPLPAPFTVMEALREVEVRMGNSGRDGFQLTLAVGDDLVVDSSLIASGIFDPPARVVLTLVMGVMPEVLIDGVVTDLQYTRSDQPGESTLHVTGEDITVMMDLEEQNRTFEGRPDSVIVTELLAPYAARYQITPMVTPTTDVPLPTDRVPSQQGTDLAHIRHLAERNGYVFYVEPIAPGVSRAYWGPDAPAGLPQPAINVGGGSHRPTDGPLQGRFEALSPVSPVVAITEPNSGVAIPVSIPNLAAVPPIVRPAQPLRTSLSRTTSGMTPAQALRDGVAATARGSDPVRVTGQMDGVRYGAVLRSRRQVGVRGMGLNWDGSYTVEQVTHRLQPGEYKQSFTLKRGGFLSPSPVVRP